MKFTLIVQHEIAYVKNEEGKIIKNYFAPDGRFFYPGVWEFEEFPKDFKVKTMVCGSLRKILDQLASGESESN